MPTGAPPTALTYDWQLSKWLPVRRYMVAPDGARYTYNDAAGVHLVNAATGADRIISTDTGWVIDGFQQEGIYAGKRDVNAQPTLSGLWLLDASGSAAPKQLAASGPWLFVGGGAAWETVGGSQSASYPWFREGSYGNTLRRLDLQSGATTTWYNGFSQQSFAIVGLDSLGVPILETTNFLVYAVTAPGATTLLGEAQGLLDAMGDSHGTWFADGWSSAVYLSNGGIGQRVGQYGYGGGIRFAGPCA